MQSEEKKQKQQQHIGRGGGGEAGSQKQPEDKKPVERRAIKHPLPFRGGRLTLSTQPAREEKAI